MRTLRSCGSLLALVLGYEFTICANRLDLIDLPWDISGHQSRRILISACGDAHQSNDNIAPT